MATLLRIPLFAPCVSKFLETLDNGGLHVVYLYCTQVSTQGDLYINPSGALCPSPAGTESFRINKVRTAGSLAVRFVMDWGRP